MGRDPEEEGGWGQRECSKFSPEVDDVMGQPGYAKYHNHHQDGLCSLEERVMEEGWRGDRSCRNTPGISEEYSAVKYTPPAFIGIFMRSCKSVKLDLTHFCSSSQDPAGDLAQSRFLEMYKVHVDCGKCGIRNKSRLRTI